MGSLLWSNSLPHRTRLLSILKLKINLTYYYSSIFGYNSVPGYYLIGLVHCQPLYDIIHARHIFHTVVNHVWQLDLQCSNVHVKFLFQIVRYIRYKKKTHIVKILNISNKLWEFTLWTCIVEWPVYTCNIMKNTRNMITQTDVNSHCHKCVNDTAWTFFLYSRRLNCCFCLAIII